MKFKQVGNKFSFEKNLLTKEFPDYMHSPLSIWIKDVLDKVGLIEDSDEVNLELVHTLQLRLHRTFEYDVDDFVDEVFEDADLTATILNVLLLNYAPKIMAEDLELILAEAGSGYQVLINDGPEEFELIDRVPLIIEKQTSKAISANDMLLEAWKYCYSRNPEYSKCVITCQNFLEHFLRDTYEPSNKKPQLGKLIGNLKAASQKLSYKGDTALDNKATILQLIDKVAEFRGMHTAGTGKIPNKEEAEYILHTTIYIWNLHQK